MLRTTGTKTPASAGYQPSQRARWAGGQPISQLMAYTLENPALISLAAGFVDTDTLPTTAVNDAWAALFQDPQAARAALQYGTTPGHPPLREQLLERTRHSDEQGPPLALDQIVVTAGSNQLLHLVSESLLDPGDIVLCAAPTYFVYLGLLAGLGARAVGVASDAEGLVPAALEEALARCEAEGELARVKAVYLVPYFDNPAGTTMPADRSAAVVETAKRWSKHGRIHVISDEAYRELRVRGRRRPQPASLGRRRRHGDRGGHLFQVVFPRDPRRLGNLATTLDRPGQRPERQRGFRLAESQPAFDGQSVSGGAVGTALVRESARLIARS